MSDELLDAPLLLGRYQPVRLLGGGGAALVFEGRDESLGRSVAIKILRSGSPEAMTQYRQELRLLAGMAHHGIVSVIDAGIDESSPHTPRPFLILELIRENTLRELLADGPLRTRAIGEIGYEIAEALDYAHARGIVHHDVTPTNIMLVDYGMPHVRPRARLTDFGIAADADALTPESGMTFGTAAYMSPEQARGAKPGPPSDIYSLGLVLLECFTGQLAFPGDVSSTLAARLERPPVFPDSIPSQWTALLRVMTRPDPDERPIAAEVLEEARHALRRRSKHRAPALTSVHDERGESVAGGEGI